MNEPRRVYLLCGVPGSGKTWCIKQVRDLFTTIENDQFIIPGYAKSDFAWEIARSAGKSTKPILADCPFGERELRELLEQKWNFEVVALFIVEPMDVVAKRYAKRQGKPAPQQVLSRALSIVNRANEWHAIRGTSTEMLANLRAIGNGLTIAPPSVRPAPVERPTRILPRRRATTAPVAPAAPAFAPPIIVTGGEDEK